MAAVFLGQELGIRLGIHAVFLGVDGSLCGAKWRLNPWDYCSVSLHAGTSFDKPIGKLAWPTREWTSQFRLDPAPETHL